MARNYAPPRIQHHPSTLCDLGIHNAICFFLGIKRQQCIYIPVVDRFPYRVSCQKDNGIMQWLIRVGWTYGRPVGVGRSNG